MTNTSKRKSQIDKFRETARALETNEDENAFNVAVRAVVTLADDLGQNDPNWTKDGKPKFKRD
jgi:hypothetical protein